MAKAFNTQRTPLSGGASRHTRSDTLHKTKYIEIKSRKTWSVFTLWRDVKAKAKKEGKQPILVLHEVGKPVYLRVEELDLKKTEEEQMGLEL